MPPPPIETPLKAIVEPLPLVVEAPLPPMPAAPTLKCHCGQAATRTVHAVMGASVMCDAHAIASGLNHAALA